MELITVISFLGVFAISGAVAIGVSAHIRVDKLEAKRKVLEADIKKIRKDMALFNISINSMAMTLRGQHLNVLNLKRYSQKIDLRASNN